MITETTLVPLEWSDGKEMNIGQWSHKQWQKGLDAGREQERSIIYQDILAIARDCYTKNMPIQANLFIELVDTLCQKHKANP